MNPTPMSKIKEDPYADGLICASLDISRHNDGNVYITIEDDSSGTRIMELKLDKSSYALLVTGLGNVKAEYNYIADNDNLSRIGKEKESRHVFCKKSKSYDKDEQKKLVKQSFDDSYMKDHGWEIWDDGTRSRQDHEEHRYIVCRWV